jgi:hypothetical protein
MPPPDGPRVASRDKDLIQIGVYRCHKSASVSGNEETLGRTQKERFMETPILRSPPTALLATVFEPSRRLCSVT